MIKRGLVGVAGLILLNLMLGCGTPSKEKGNPRGIIPYVLKDFDKKYAPRTEDNYIEYEERYILPNLKEEQIRMLRNVYRIEF